MNDTKKNSRDFVYTIPELVLHNENLTYLDKHIYMLIRSFMDTTGDAYPSNGWIAKKCGVERRSVIKSLNRLIKEQLIIKKTINNRRHLFIRQSGCPIELVISESPPRDPTITPPRDPRITQLDQSNIRSKNISSQKREKKPFSSQPEVVPEEQITQQSADDKKKHPASNAQVCARKTKKINAQEFIAIWNALATVIGCPAMLKNKRQLTAIKRNLEAIANNWDVALTPENFEAWLKNAILADFYLITKYKSRMDVVLRLHHFQDANEAIEKYFNE